MPKYRLTIVQDRDPANPRERNENLGKMACEPHRNQCLGDGLEPSDMPIDKDIVALPLYLYDHSGITMKTTPFACEWDSGQVGVIYCTKDKARDILGNDVSDETIRQSLRDEVEEYDNYISGEVYGYSLERSNECSCCHNIEWEEIDSCYGFSGSNHEASGLASEVEYNLPNEAKGLLEIVMDSNDNTAILDTDIVSSKNA